MPDSYLRQSGLAHLALGTRAVADRGEAGVAMKEVPFKGLVNLRGKPGDKQFLAAAEKALGTPLPLEPNTAAAKGEVTVLWLSPEEWLVITPDDGPRMADKLLGALSGLHVSVVDVSESRTCIHRTGPQARKVMMKAGPLDVYDIYVLRSFSDYLWRWLEDAGREYGVAVLTQA
ncbi:MAG: sarcosine oxidase subunit gamma family protein [Limibacillus sp.]